MVIARDIVAGPGRRGVLHRLSFRAEAGQVTAIIGPSGAGKSTLLKVLSCDQPFRGEVTLNGRDIRGAPPAEMARQRAVLPQATPMAFPFTVAEVVRLGLHEAMALPHVVAQALGRVGLAGREAALFQELSGGEQQRVHLARVLAQVWAPVTGGVPRWLLLDEPVSSLDIKHQLQIMDVARQFADAGGGVIAVLHDLNLAAMYADQILALRQGRLAGCGRPADVLTDALLTELFDCALRVGVLPAPAIPFVLPQSAQPGAAIATHSSKVA